MGEAGAALARGAAALALVALVAACGHGGDFVLPEQLPAGADGDAAYHLAAGDIIAVRVWNQDAMSAPRVRVRDDGRISLPLVHDVAVAGMTPSELARRLETTLKEFVQNPIVTVTVEEPRPLRVSVIGEVTRPGVYDLDATAGVLQALAAAGGLTAFAETDGIFVLRQKGDATAAPTRIRFTYERLARGDRPAAVFRLRHGDVVVVER